MFLTHYVKLICENLFLSYIKLWKKSLKGRLLIQNQFCLLFVYISCLYRTSVLRSSVSVDPLAAVLWSLSDHTHSLLYVISALFCCELSDQLLSLKLSAGSWLWWEAHVKEQSLPLKLGFSVGFSDILYTILVNEAVENTHRTTASVVFKA